MKINIIIASEREGRATPRMAKWIQKTAQTIEKEQDWQVVDLGEYDLPKFTEPMPPMTNKNRQLDDSTKKYLEKMKEADGFLIVTPEYNHGMPGVIKNALDLLDFQIMKKPVAVTSHGVVGGSRANEQVRQVINSNLGAVPIPTGVTMVGRPNELIDESGNLHEGHEHLQSALDRTVHNLSWYADALKAAREKNETS